MNIPCLSPPTIEPAISGEQYTRKPLEGVRDIDSSPRRAVRCNLQVTLPFGSWGKSVDRRLALLFLDLAVFYNMKRNESKEALGFRHHTANFILLPTKVGYFLNPDGLSPPCY